MATLKGNGLQFDGGYGLSASKPTQNSGWFHYNHQFTSGFDYCNIWTDCGQTSADWAMPAKAMIFVYYYSPTRGDTNDWGGMYCNLYYRINSGSWRDCGHTGFTTRMRTDSYNITRHTGFAVFNMASQTSDFTMAFKINHKEYSGGGAVNNSCSLDTGQAGDRISGNYCHWKNVIVTGYAAE